MKYLFIIIIGCTKVKRVIKINNYSRIKESMKMDYYKGTTVKGQAERIEV